MLQLESPRKKISWTP
uniref:Uncharacterized protein n=1 Tax=Arundo donax TaxID=35708 RepID=A0A0A9BM42_ARUDO